MLTAIALSLALSVAHAGDTPAWEPDPNADRADVPGDTKWDLSPLFESDAAWSAEADAVEGDLAELDAFQGTLGDPARLEACLGTYFDLHARASSLSLYASLQATVERTDPDFLAMEARAQGLMAELMDRSSFIRIEVLALPEKKLDKAYKKRPGLEAYRRYLGEFRRRQHTVLHPDGERALSQLGDNLWAEVDLNELHAPPEDAFRALMANMPLPVVHDEEGAEVQLTLSLYPTLRRSEDRAVRQEAVTALFGTLRQYQDVFAATLGGQAEMSVGYARARGYDTALEAYLDKDDIDPDVYRTLVSTVRANLEPLHRFVSLRKEVLGLEDGVHFHDMYVPLVGGVDREIPYDEGREMILEALTPLGEDYVAILAEGLDPANGWIDIYPSAQKRPGAFCAYTWGAHPYVMMNYQDGLYDVSTLAHEYGHAAHSHLSGTHQGQPDFAYKPFLAEIASTANEVLLEDHLIASAGSDAERDYLLVQRANSLKGTIYRQALFAAFELQLHEYVEQGTPVTAALLDETYASLVQEWYGPDYVLGPDDGMEWAYVPHLYYKYYLFTYATGLSSGIALARGVQEDPAKTEAFLGMLRGGASQPPLDLLRAAGVDLSTPAPIEAALGLFEETVTELEQGLLE